MSVSRISQGHGVDGKTSRNGNISSDVCIRTGGGGDAIAPTDKFIPARRHSGDSCAGAAGNYCLRRCTGYSTVSVSCVGQGIGYDGKGHISTAGRNPVISGIDTVMICSSRCQTADNGADTGKSRSCRDCIRISTGNEAVGSIRAVFKNHRRDRDTIIINRAIQSSSIDDDTTDRTGGSSRGDGGKSHIGAESRRPAPGVSGNDTVVICNTG